MGDSLQLRSAVTSHSIRSGSSRTMPSVGNPPASATAAASSHRETPPMPASRIGMLQPRRSQSGVRSIRWALEITSCAPAPMPQLGNWVKRRLGYDPETSPNSAIRPDYSSNRPNIGCSIGVGLKFRTVSGLEPNPPSRVLAEPFVQGCTGCNLFDPVIESQIVLARAARPEPVDQQARARDLLHRVIDAGDAEADIGFQSALPFAMISSALTE